MAKSSRQKPPCLYVIDEDFVLPDRGDEQEGAPESAVPAGDPDEAVRLFHSYRRLMAQILGYEEDLAEVEESLGVVLPPDLRALYGIADGDGENLWIDADLPQLPVEHATYSDDRPSRARATQAGPRVQEDRVVVGIYSPPPPRTRLAELNGLGHQL
ncbi:SMI1/KNR4 family protein [Nonomuraea sp. NPDC049028]|uniref:SMI1/KNR4 family protein n=1 Tax=Nonomuraea sp. NPDC049028 TaxID=3364348 RepID=UPI00371A0765